MGGFPVLKDGHWELDSCEIVVLDLICVCRMGKTASLLQPKFAFLSEYGAIVVSLFE